VTRYRRGTLSVDEELVAVAAGLAAGLAGLYLARRWLAREPIPAAAPDPGPPDARPGDADEPGRTADPER